MGELGTNLGSSFASAFQGMADQLTDFVTTGKASFGDFARSVLKDLSNILIKFALFQALKAIVPGGSAFGKFLGFADGAAFAQNGIQPFARGGIVDRPTLFPFANGTGLMGEAGPEAIIPLKRGRDGKLGVMQWRWRHHQRGRQRRRIRQQRRRRSSTSQGAWQRNQCRRTIRASEAKKTWGLARIMATFTFTPSFPAELQEQPTVRTVKFSDGYEQRLTFGLNTDPKVWSLQFSNRDDTERNNILTFLRARNGQESFDWTDPNSYSGKWVCSEWRTSQVSCNFNNITATFREVFEP
jgi:phage-related protein